MQKNNAKYPVKVVRLPTETATPRFGKRNNNTDRQNREGNTE
jgi:hypothetical protein